MDSGAPLAPTPLDPADLFAAISDERLHTVVQPLVDMRSGALTRLEALARWTDPGRGEIPPSEFIPLAERVGFITPLTLLTLRQVAPALAHLRSARADLTASVNVAGATLLWPGFQSALSGILDKAGCPVQAIGLEITESTIMTDPDAAQEALASLRSAGIRIDLDDFGTGYSSLGRLAELPLDALKVDRLFVTAMATDPKHEAIVRATIALGHDLGLEVVAEGVEDRETWELLLSLGCDTAQGYHIARPMPFTDVEHWSERWQAGLGSIGSAEIGDKLLAPRASSILVVEHQPTIREVVRGILEREDYQVLTAANGAEALRLIGQGTPKVILLDVNVPIVGAAKIVEIARAKHPPIAIVVMGDGPSAARWAEKLGADGALAKPLDIASLVDLTAKLAG